MISNETSDQRAVILAEKILLAGFGIHCSLKGMLLPYIKAEFLISYTQSGLLIASSTVGFALSALFSGKIAEKVGQMQLLSFYALMMSLTALVIILANTIDWIIVAFFLSGITYCGVESLSTSIIKKHSPAGKEDKTVSSVFAFYMVGGIVSSLICFFILRFNGNWRIAYSVAGIPCFAASVLLFIQSKNSLAVSSDNSFNFSNLGFYLRNKSFLFMCLATALFSGVETSTHNWITVFITDGAQLKADETCVLLALFYICITFGRVVCTKILNHADTRVVASSALGLSFITLLALSFAKSTAFVWILTALYGFCTSALYPMLVSVTSGICEGAIAYSLTFISISIGNISTNSLMGVIADAFGVRSTFRFDGLLIALSILFVALSFMRKRKKA